MWMSMTDFHTASIALVIYQWYYHSICFVRFLKPPFGLVAVSVCKLSTGWMKYSDTGLDWKEQEVKDAIDITVQSCDSGTMEVTEAIRSGGFEGIYPER